MNEGLVDQIDAYLRFLRIVARRWPLIFPYVFKLRAKGNQFLNVKFTCPIEADDVTPPTPLCLTRDLLGS